jgi:hypothetical protein
MKASGIVETPFFFTVTAQDRVFKLAAKTEEDRARWVAFLKNMAVSLQYGAVPNSVIFVMFSGYRYLTSWLTDLRSFPLICVYYSILETKR